MTSVRQRLGALLGTLPTVHAIFHGEGVDVVRTPYRAPQANALPNASFELSEPNVSKQPAPRAKLERLFGLLAWRMAQELSYSGIEEGRFGHEKIQGDPFGTAWQHRFDARRLRPVATVRRDVLLQGRGLHRGQRRVDMSGWLRQKRAGRSPPRRPASPRRRSARPNSVPATARRARRGPARAASSCP